MEMCEPIIVHNIVTPATPAQLRMHAQELLVRLLESAEIKAESSSSYTLQHIDDRLKVLWDMRDTTDSLHDRAAIEEEILYLHKLKERGLAE